MADNLKCSQCGKSHNPEARFCGNCGNQFTNNLVFDNLHSIDQHQLPEMFYEIDFLLQNHKSNRSNRVIRPNELNQVLNAFEKGHADSFERAKSALIDSRPIQAVDQLWRMKGKLFFSEDKKGDVYEVLGEIGGDKVVNLLIKDEYVHGDDLLFRLLALNKIKSPVSAEWLGKQTDSIFNFPHYVVAMKCLEKLNSPNVISILCENAGLAYVEAEDDTMSARNDSSLTKMIEDVTLEEIGLKKRRKVTSGSLIGGAIFAGIGALAAYAKNKKIKTDLSVILPSPFLPLETPINDPTNFLSKFVAERYRLSIVSSFLDRFGNSYLERCTNDPNMLNNSTGQSFLTGCLLFKGIDHPTIDNTINGLMRKKILINEVHLSLIFIIDSMIRGKSSKHLNKYRPMIRQLINCKEDFVALAIMSSIIFSNYSPLIPEVLSNPLSFHLTPSLAYSNLMHDNPDVKHFAQKLDGENRKTLQSWEETYRAWLV
jgi:hypothetical protein